MTGQTLGAKGVPEMYLSVWNVSAREFQGNDLYADGEGRAHI